MKERMAALQRQNLAEWMALGARVKDQSVELQTTSLLSTISCRKSWKVTLKGEGRSHSSWMRKILIFILSQVLQKEELEFSKGQNLMKLCSRKARQRLLRCFTQRSRRI